jgi:hypothetical protein
VVYGGVRVCVWGGGGTESIVNWGQGQHALLEADVLDHCLDHHVNKTYCYGGGGGGGGGERKHCMVRAQVSTC